MMKTRCLNKHLAYLWRRLKGGAVFAMNLQMGVALQR